MDLSATVSGFPNATPLEELTEAWRWSPNPMFHFTAALSTDRTRLLQVNVMGRYDQELVVSILKYARERVSPSVMNGHHLVPFDGFTHPGYEFDTIAIVPPAVHDYHANENPELHKLTLAAFPGSTCEFSGTESEEEAWGRFRKMLQPTKLDRESVPFLKMRYNNTKTKSGSRGSERGFTKLPILLRELELLQNAPGSFVEWENRHREVRNVEWDNGWILQLNSSSEQSVALGELLQIAEDSVMN